MSEDRRNEGPSTDSRQGVEDSTLASGKDHPKDSREVRRQREREALLSDLAAERLDTVRARVAYVLNHYPAARNSDRVLFLTYWKTFQPSVLGRDGRLNEEKVLQLENPMSLTRARQKIQNEFGLFGPTGEVQRYRRERQEEFRREMLLDKPDIPLVTVYGDETGKTGKYAIVGSMWTLDARRYSQFITRALRFRADRNINYEFHFNELTRHKVSDTKAFFQEALAHADTFSFRAVGVNQEGLSRSVEELYLELYYRLVMDGLEEEISRNRLTLPRTLWIFKDKDKTNDVLDALSIARLRDRLSLDLNRKYGEDIKLELVETVDSRGNPLIQLADLFAGSLNRKLNTASGPANHKDEVATFILDMLGLTVTPDGTVGQGDQDLASFRLI